jgi:hypothetical protein
MPHHFLDLLRSSLIGKPSSPGRKKPRRAAARRRRMAFESLESRQMLSITTLQDFSVSTNSGEKPQSKAWEYQGKMYSVMAASGGTWLWQLNGTQWAEQLKLTTKSANVDVKVVGDVAHILLFEGTQSELASVQFDTGSNKYAMWSQRPQLVNITLDPKVETATIDIDSTGRMWLASDAKTKSTMQVCYSDGNYSNWSAPITVATGVAYDDISDIIAMPNHTIGVFWSNQNARRFGFRTHVDGTDPTQWTANEVPAGQYAQNKVHGMADDHMHLAAASDGTLYVAAKTGYDTSGYPTIILLVRRPNGVWDAPYAVNTGGTRPVIVLNEAANQLIIAYTSKDGGGTILYRTSPLGTISLSPVQTLIAGTTNNVTTAKQEFTDKVVFLAEGGGAAKSVLFSFDNVVTPPPSGPVNTAPVVNAGSDQTIVIGSSVQLSGIVTDDQLPNPPGIITTTWSKVSGPGNVTFASGSTTATSASFSLAGQYVLRLTANDGSLSSSDDIAVNVIDPSSPVTVAFQDGASPTNSYQGTRDTKLDSGSKTSNFGAANSIKADGSPDIGDLFDWDISAIPTNGTVDSATIQLNATSASKKSFPLYVMNRTWDEFGATWNQASSGNPWSVAGASGAVDHGSTAIGQITPTKTGLVQIVLNQTGIAALQAWVNNPSSNFGVILQNYASSDGFSLSTSEASTVSQRPKLTITYHVPANLTPAQIAALTVGPINQTPQVNAGVAQTITLPASAVLHPSVADDGLPTPASLLTTWSKVSGPGSVTFGDLSAANTSAQFSVAGTYVLRLTVSDGLLASTSDITITVLPPIV